jgi:hypothetical protein
MRCFFMKDGHITAVQLLNSDTDDGLVEQATKAFYAKGGRGAADGFEVWDGPRFVSRFPPDLITPPTKAEP